MKAKNRTSFSIIGLVFGVLFFCTPHAGASLVSPPDDNELVAYIASSSGFDKTGYLAHSWQTLSKTDLMRKGPNSISVPLQNLEIASTAPASAFLSFIEKKLDGLELSSTRTPGSAWLLGFGLIGLVSIRGGNRSWKHSMG